MKLTGEKLHQYYEFCDDERNKGVFHYWEDIGSLQKIYIQWAKALRKRRWPLCANDISETFNGRTIDHCDPYVQELYSSMAALINEEHL